MICGLIKGAVDRNVHGCLRFGLLKIPGGRHAE